MDPVKYKICCNCNTINSKYKCPSCQSFYCSVTCYKNHKTICNNSSAVKPTDIKIDEFDSNESSQDYEFPTEDTVPINKLVELKYSQDVKDCLKNSHVRNIVQSVLTAENPTEAIAQAMMEPIFVELADACLKVVEPHDKEL